MNVLFLFVSLFSFSAHAIPEAPIYKQERVISMNGDAIVQVEPNLLLLSLAVESRGSSVVEAQKKNNKIIQDILRFWSKKLKLNAKDIQTDVFRVFPQQNPCVFSAEGCDEIQPEFVVEKNIQIRLRDISLYEKLINHLFSVGITRLNHMQFTHTDIRKYSDRAREQATQAAKEKAESVAKVLGVKVGAPTYIQVYDMESLSEMFSQNRNSNVLLEDVLSDSSLENLSIALGQIIIRARVAITFEIY